MASVKQLNRIIGALLFLVAILGTLCGILICIVVPSPSTGTISVTDSLQSTPNSIMPSFLFVGDSNTEIASDPDLLGFHIQFTHDYIRKADMINRGHSGWTTRSWINALPTLISQWSAMPPTLVILFLGTNDSCLPNSNTPSTALYVPIDEYQRNLKTLIHSFQSIFKSRVILVTPPPFDELSIRFRNTRTNDFTGSYATAMADVGYQMNVPVIDLWTPLQVNKSAFFYDGVHFNSKGHNVVHTMIANKIREVYPDLSPEKMPVFAY